MTRSAPSRSVGTKPRQRCSTRPSAARAAVSRPNSGATTRSRAPARRSSSSLRAATSPPPITTARRSSSLRKIGRYSTRLVGRFGGRSQSGQPIEAPALAEIAETLGAVAVPGPERGDRLQHPALPVDRHALEDALVQPRSLEIAAEKDGIGVRSPADQADIAGIGPGAAVRTAGDAQRESLVSKDRTSVV